jgi:tetraacyldisaccharide 4'-kinase
LIGSTLQPVCDLWIERRIRQPQIPLVLMRRTMVKIWKGEAPVARAFLFPFLVALSLLYRAALVARELVHRVGIIRAARAAIPVISVGNLSLGGTGKTTVVERLSMQLKERGLRPGIVMRGYGKRRAGTFAVDTKQDTARSAGDEATMLARRTALPVIVGKHRGEGIEKGVRDFGIDIAVFDDGYQVRNVYKDVELLIVKGSEPRASMHLFPLGFLREPLEMARKADIILVNKGELVEPIASLAVGKPVFSIKYRPLHLFNFKKRGAVDYRYAAGRKVLAFAGLGDNASFFDLLREIGADLVKTVEFPDHYEYTAEDMTSLQAFAGAEVVLTTEKDAVKIDRFEVGDNFFYLSVEAQIENETAFIDSVLEKARR